MAILSATASDYAEMVRERKKNIQGVSEWERMFLQPLQQQFETDVQQAKEKTSYDISGAFANYKKQQRNLMQNQTLSEGFKQQVAKDLQAAYGAEYASIAETGREKINSLTQSYLKNIQSGEASLQEQGAKLQKLEGALLDFANKSYSDLETSGYVTSDNASEYTLTEKGKDFFNEVLNTKYGTTYDEKGNVINEGQWFGDYLSEQDRELYDFLVGNTALIDEVIAGGVAKDSANRTKATILERELEQKYGDYYNAIDMPEFKSQSARIAYLEKQRELADVFNSPATQLGEKLRNLDFEKYSEDDLKKLKDLLYEKYGKQINLAKLPE